MEKQFFALAPVAGDDEGSFAVVPINYRPKKARDLTDTQKNRVIQILQVNATTTVEPPGIVTASEFNIWIHSEFLRLRKGNKKSKRARSKFYKVYPSQIPIEDFETELEAFLDESGKAASGIKPSPTFAIVAMATIYAVWKLFTGGDSANA